MILRADRKIAPIFACKYRLLFLCSVTQHTCQLDCFPYSTFMSCSLPEAVLFPLRFRHTLRNVCHFFSLPHCYISRQQLLLYGYFYSFILLVSFFIYDGTLLNWSAPQHLLWRRQQVSSGLLVSCLWDCEVKVWKESKRALCCRQRRLSTLFVGCCTEGLRGCAWSSRKLVRHLGIKQMTRWLYTVFVLGWNGAVIADMQLLLGYTKLKIWEPCLPMLTAHT